ncbi:acetylserotonin O-methyltransferase-like [Antedon mediterranea]|uniref:acetylserotonin O-methyltransferase-like n=1 Tax=Antedon mediterranea TaxID=105859 RepID=UPI003AF63271
MENKTNSKLWPSLLVDINDGFQKSQVLFVTTELQLYDLLATHQNGMTANEIASRKELNLEATERILDCAAGLKLIEKKIQSESKIAIYKNYPEIATFLQSSTPNSMVETIICNSHVTYALYQNLMTTIQTGHNTEGCKHAFNSDVRNI